MSDPRIQQLAKAKAEVARLERSITEELASLHKEYGFDSVETFIVALEAAGPGWKSQAKKAATVRARKRAKITDAIRAKVGKFVKAGKAGSQIAKDLKISLPSVQNIKKELGLVKGANKPAPKAKARPASIKKSMKRKTLKERPPAKKAVKLVSNSSLPVADAATNASI